MEVNFKIELGSGSLKIIDCGRREDGNKAKRNAIIKIA